MDVKSLKPDLHRNVNATFKNYANVRCRRVIKARQTAFSCATNIRQTAKCYLSTVGTSKGIHIQYIYVGSSRCLGKCWTVYECTVHSASALVRIRVPFACRYKPGLRLLVYVNEWRMLKKSCWVRNCKNSDRDAGKKCVNFEQRLQLYVKAKGHPLNIVFSHKKLEVMYF